MANKLQKILGSDAANFEKIINNGGYEFVLLAIMADATDSNDHKFAAKLEKFISENFNPENVRRVMTGDF